MHGASNRPNSRWNKETIWLHHVKIHNSLYDESKTQCGEKLDNWYIYIFLMFVSPFEIPKRRSVFTWMIIFNRFAIFWRNAFLPGIRQSYRLISERFMMNLILNVSPRSASQSRLWLVAYWFEIVETRRITVLKIKQSANSPAYPESRNWRPYGRSLPFCHFIRMLQKINFCNGHFSSVLREEIFNWQVRSLDNLFSLNWQFHISYILYFSYKNNSSRFKDLHQSQSSSNICYSMQ